MIEGAKTEIRMFVEDTGTPLMKVSLAEVYFDHGEPVGFVAAPETSGMINDLEKLSTYASPRHIMNEELRKAIRQSFRYTIESLQRRLDELEGGIDGEFVLVHNDGSIETIPEIKDPDWELEEDGTFGTIKFKEKA
jgi:hypothetical protein